MEGTQTCTCVCVLGGGWDMSKWVTREGHCAWGGGQGSTAWSWWVFRCSPKKSHQAGAPVHAPARPSPPPHQAPPAQVEARTVVGDIHSCHVACLPVEELEDVDKLEDNCTGHAQACACAPCLCVRVCACVCMCVCVRGGGHMGTPNPVQVSVGQQLQ
jgi:hypothetical protein